MLTTPQQSAASVVFNATKLAFLELLAYQRSSTALQAHRFVGLAIGNTATRTARKHLTELYEAELVERVRSSRFGEYRYYLTAKGAELVERPSNVPIANRRTLEGSGGKHLNAVVELGSFLAEEASYWGNDRFSYTSYRQEVTLRYGPHRDDFLKVDAVISYDEAGHRRTKTHTRLVELDRGTEPITTLYQKVENYVRWAGYQPKRSTTNTAPLAPKQWQRDFPGLDQPPRVMFVFDCDPQTAKTRSQLLTELLAKTSGWSNSVRVEATMLKRLDPATAGPFAASTAAAIFPTHKSATRNTTFFKSDRTTQRPATRHSA